MPARASRRRWFLIATVATSLLVGAAIAQALFTPARRHEARRLGRSIERAVGVQRRMPSPPASAPTPTDQPVVSSAPPDATGPPAPPSDPPLTDQPLTPEAAGTNEPPRSLPPESSNLGFLSDYVRFVRGGWVVEPGYSHYAPWSIYRGFYPGDPRGVFQRLPDDGAWTLDWNLRFLDPHKTVRRDSQRNGRFYLRLEPQAVPGQPWVVALTSSTFELAAGASAPLLLRARADAPRTIQCALQDIAAGGPSGRPQEIQLGPETTEHHWVSDPVASAGSYIAYVNLAESPIGLDFELLTRVDAAGAFARVTDFRHYVEYHLNSAGYRGEDFDPQPAPDVARIACIGDSYVFGLGVPEGQTLCDHLREDLRRERPSARLEVLNFGTPGSSPDQELVRYREVVRATRPRVVVLTVCSNDHITGADEVAFRANFAAGSPEYAFAYRKNFYDHGFAKCTAAIAELQSQCAADRATLVVGAYEHDQGEEWLELDHEVGQFCRERGILYFNPKSALVEHDLFLEPGMVYPEGPYDSHPNGAAHKIYARVLYETLRDAGLLDTR